MFKILISEFLGYKIGVCVIHGDALYMEKYGSLIKV